MGVNGIGEYSDNYRRYANSIPGLRRKFFHLKRTEPLSLDDIRGMTPYGIAFAAGFPLFRTPAMARDYRLLIRRLMRVAPNQWFYEVPETHISLNVTIRADRRGYRYGPEGDKKEFYRRYLRVLESIHFSPFSLRLVGIYPNGIMLWKPVENKDAIFRIRSRIDRGLMSEMRKHRKTGGGLFHFDSENGRPVMPGIIHTTFMRPIDREEYNRRFASLSAEIDKLNVRLARGEIFHEPLWVNEVVFMEEHWHGHERITACSEIPGCYGIEIIARRAKWRSLASVSV